MGTKLIILLVIVLSIVAVAQFMKMYDSIVALRGKREEEVNLRANNLNASLMIVFLIVFMVSFVYMLAVYGNGMLPEAASAHGQDIDWLYGINWIIVFFVFVLCNGILFIFAYKYTYKPGVKAYYFPHDNRLEMIWTVVPAAVLAVIIILGLMTWNSITDKASDDAVVVEIYAKQFDFTARYAGDDNKLGYSDYKLVSTYDKNSNPLGVVTQNNLDWRIYEIQQNLIKTDSMLRLVDEGKAIMSKASYLKKTKENEKMARIQERVWMMKKMYGDTITAIAADDFYTKTELFLIKDQEYKFVFRSQDVIHSAYFPHFRAQMNCVPGQRTTFKFKPIFTTEEMREKTGNPNFSYVLLCNKICGKSHSMMNMPVYVGTADEYNAWKNPEAGNTTAIVAPDSLFVQAPMVVEPAPLIDPNGGGHGHDEEHGEETEDHGGH